MKTWNDIRTDWVNGNLTDAKEGLYQESKSRMLRIILEAIQNHREYHDNPTGTNSGDLQDLYEILRSYGR
jgi:hypothetical protein